MPLLFPYVQLPSGRANDPTTRLVWVTATGPKNTYFERCLLDSGADDTVFPDSAAARLGIDLTNAPVGEATGVASSPIPVRFVQVSLRITDGREFCEWLAWVGFTSAPLRQPLLGFSGCLQFFHADFRGDREEVELTTNTLYAGRSGAFAA